MNSPDILFDLKAHQFLDNYDTNNKTQKESAFFHCQNSYDPINYYTRKGASEQEDFDTIKAMEQLNAQTNMSDKDIISYASDRPGSTGLWDRKGDITDKAQLKDIRSKLRDHKSTVWSSVVSFTPEYAEKYCRNKVDAQRIISNTIDDFFKAAKLDPENMEWYGAFHINTKHPHCHLVFWEKQPNAVNTKTGEVDWASWKLPVSSIKKFPILIGEYNISSKLKNFTLRDENRKTLIDRFEKHNHYSRIMSELDKELGDDVSSQYGRLSKENQSIVNKYINKLIRMNPDLQLSHNRYLATVDKTSQEYKKLYQQANMKIPMNIKFYRSKVIKDYYSRLGNTVMQYLKIYKAEEKSFNDAKKELYEKYKTERKNRSAYGQSTSYMKEVRKLNNPLTALNTKLDKSLLELLESVNEDELKKLNKILKEGIYDSLEEEGDNEHEQGKE